MFELDDRVALVTGSARGIGKAIARKLFEAGATVVIADLSQDDVDRASAEIAEAAESGGAERVLGFTCDVSKPDSVRELIESVKAKLGRLDILVNNAGITRDCLFAKMTLEQWNTVIDVNLNGTFHCCHFALPLLRSSKNGRIINISSLAAGGNIGQANYAASKAAVIGLTRTLAIELARRHVTANAVAPGFIDTDMTRAVSDKARQHWIDHVPAGRAGTPDDVASAVVFLASDGASYITGEVLEVDGGMKMPEAVSASFRGPGGGPSASQEF